MTQSEGIGAEPADAGRGPLRSAATWFSHWIFGSGAPDTAGYYVSGATWPAGARDTDLPIPQLYEVLNDSFDNYFDSAMISLAKVQPPTEVQTPPSGTEADPTLRRD